MDLLNPKFHVKFAGIAIGFATELEDEIDY